MPKVKSNESGFGAVEAVLVSVIVILIGVVGWMVYKDHHKKTTENASASSSKQTASVSTLKADTKPAQKTAKPASPYAGWKTYTLPVEKLSFMYPSQWTISAADTGAPTSTQDQVTLNASDGFKFYVIDGVSNGGDPRPEASDAPVSIKYLGQSDYLVFGYARQPNSLAYSTSLVGSAGLRTNPYNQYSYPLDKYAVGPNDTTGAINAKSMAISCQFKTPLTIAQAQSNPDFKDCKLVIESMRY